MLLNKYILLFFLLLPGAAHAECTDCRMSERGVQLIRVFEGFSPFVYKDAGGLPTIGYGHLIQPGEKFVEPLIGPPAEQLLIADIKPKERDVNRLVIIPLRQPQFDALTCFTFNVGSGSFGGSTLLKKVNASDHAGAALQFSRWVNVNGKPLRGLIMRRRAESNLYLEPTP